MTGEEPDVPVTDGPGSPVPDPPVPAPPVPDPPATDAAVETPASNALARLLVARGVGTRAGWPRLPSVSLPTVSLPSVSLRSVSLPSVSLPFGRRERPADDLGTDATVDVAPPPDDRSPDDALTDEPPAALHAALGDALVEAVAVDPALQDEPDEPVEAGGIEDRVAEWVARAIESYPRPSYPMTREWDVSVQGIVRLVPFLPRFATAPLGLLDRFGAVTISPDKVGLDGRDVAWDRVVEVRTEPAWTCLSAEVFEADLAQYITVIPPVPGRGWVLRRISELLMSLYLAVLPPDEVAEAGLDGAAEVDESLMSAVVTTITYERRFGRGEATVSAPSALLQLALPGTADTIVRTARARGVAVTHVPAEETSVGSVIQRAATWRRSATGLRDDLAARWGRS